MKHLILKNLLISSMNNVNFNDQNIKPDSKNKEKVGEYVDFEELD